MDNGKPQFKTKVNGSDISMIDANLKLKDVALGKNNVLIDKILSEPPHVFSITKNQLAWGSWHFKHLDEHDPIRAPFVGSAGNNWKHIYGCKPSDNAYAKMERLYGIVFRHPPDGFYDLIQACFLQTIDRVIAEKLNIAIVPMTGYIDKDGNNFDPKSNHFEPFHHLKISEYLFYACDKKRIAIVQKYGLLPDIDKTHYRLKLVIERTKITASEHYGAQVASAETKIGRAESRALKLMQSSLSKLKTTEKNIDWKALKGYTPK